MALKDTDRQKVRQLIAEHRSSRGALLPLLHAVQALLGWIPDDVVPLIADGLNQSRADVHGVLTFYHDFRRAPPAARMVKLCRAEACKARGSDRLERELKDRVQVPGGPLAVGDVAIEPVYCLGLCATGPNALVDGRPYSRLSVDRIEAVLAC